MDRPKPEIPGGLIRRLGGPRGRAVAGAIVLVAALGLLTTQITVSDPGSGVERSCGSALDSVADRSGWETWWARDLDEPDPAVRAVLLRTTQCPDAVNQRTAMAAVLLAVGSALLVSGFTGGESASLWRPGRAGRSGAVERLGRAGRVATGVGVALAVAGAGGILLLIADADSTLFLYTPRLVVALLGVVILMPTLALIILGRLVTVVADVVGSDDEDLVSTGGGDGSDG